jgi:hypothetical protein
MATRQSDQFVTAAGSRHAGNKPAKGPASVWGTAAHEFLAVNIVVLYARDLRPDHRRLSAKAGIRTLEPGS